MTSNNKHECSTVIDTSDKIENFNKSIEVIRKCSGQEENDTSWGPIHYNDSFSEKYKEDNITPPFMSAMITDISLEKVDKTNNSTQTEAIALPTNCSSIAVSLSFSKDFNLQDSSSNENFERPLSNKRNRCNSGDGDNKEQRPWKKTKCTNSSTPTSSSESTDHKSEGPSESSSQLSSSSEASFKSVNSSPSFKVRKRRLKSECNLYRDALQRSSKSINLSKGLLSENNNSGKHELKMYWLSDGKHNKIISQSSQS